YRALLAERDAAEEQARQAGSATADPRKETESGPAQQADAEKSLKDALARIQMLQEMQTSTEAELSQARERAQPAEARASAAEKALADARPWGRDRGPRMRPDPVVPLAPRPRDVPDPEAFRLVRIDVPNGEYQQPAVNGGRLKLVG